MAAESLPDVDVVDGSCPVTVGRASMIHRWSNLTFLHWPFTPDEVARLLLGGFRPDTFDGVAWVGLVPFEMTVKAGRGPGIPWFSHFPETNVRTYVVAPGGSRGVHFLSLDASRLLAVLGGGTTYAMPYFWSAMRVVNEGGNVAYTCVRRWPGRRSISSHVSVEIGEHIPATGVTDLEHSSRHAGASILDFAATTMLRWLTINHGRFNGLR